MEILISIGVLSVGLLGVLALLPAASSQAKAGAQQDAAAALGRRAFREMNVRWYGVQGATTLPPSQANFFLVDPLGTILTGSSQLGGTTQISGINSARRVVPVEPSGGVIPRFFTQPALDHIFRSRDDVSFGEIGGRENPAPNPPQQVAAKNSAGDPIRRYSNGNLSWFATVVPRTTGFNTVSIAIVSKRTGEFVTPDPASTPNVANNPVVAISGGIGEILLSLNPPPLNLPLDEAWSKLKAGHWILLVSVNPGATLSGTAEWYRVQANATMDANTSDADNTDNARALTVVGPDWTPPPGHAFYAVLIPDVIAVYTRNLPATP